VLPGSLQDGNNTPREHGTPTSSEELLREYAAGQRLFRDADIPDGSSLQNAVLAGAVFKDSWLSDVDFRGADLRGCRFESCNLKCSDFREADLRGAAFTGYTPIEATMWDGPKVEGTDFSGVTFHGSYVSDPEFPFGRFGGRC
jgi:uncharacterized protein YjbI with pentapeptide repeats